MSTWNVMHTDAYCAAWALTDLLFNALYTSISEVAHSAYVDSPLGPDAFHEYESLLLQDYEELVRKHEKHEIQFHAQSDIRKAKSEK